MHLGDASDLVTSPGESHGKPWEAMTALAQVASSKLTYIDPGKWGVGR